MKTMKFKCTLISDIILSRSSSTEGNQSCLDFIPGNNFLGVVANYLYKKVGADALDIFHSGKVRFGDANPSIDGKRRGLKVPAAMFYPKLKKASEICYIHHLIDNPDDEAIKELQLKQCREGFYAFSENIGEPVGIDKNFTIKSAYDTSKRKSKDGQMFGYQSLPKGLILYFEVESELDNNINNDIKKALVGIRQIGHSRTAQYGLVNIEDTEYSDVESVSLDGGQYATVYADGRLIFLDENGEPTYKPTPKDLGFNNDAEIVWSKSQIRTFQYSPWNGKRHSYDTDRCGIEKGSVFVVKTSFTPSTSQYVGSYRNEGFGKVIYNPEFLKGNGDGKALYTLKEASEKINPKGVQAPLDSSLISFLLSRKKEQDENYNSYSIANKFISVHEHLFKGEQFASQWGSIRNLAMISSSAQSLKESVEFFLDHGVAKDKWNERNRSKILLNFMSNHFNDNLQDIIINLASEMAKRCRKEK